MCNYLFAALIAASLTLVACGGAAAPNANEFVPSGTASPSAGPEKVAAPVSGSPIYHVIVVIQENRTFDNLFASSALNGGAGYPGANTPAGLTFTVAGTTSPLAEVPFEEPFDPDHSHDSLLSEWETQVGNPATTAADENVGFYEDTLHPVAPEPSPPAGAVFAYVPDFETLLYHELAYTYALADNMFSSRLVPTFPGHMFLISGQSELAADDPLEAGQTSTINGTSPSIWGCDSPAGTFVPLFTGSNTDQSQQPTSGTGTFPCFNQTTIGDLMDRKGVSWKYYTGALTDTVDASFDVYDAIQHIRDGTDWNADISTPETNIITDIQNCNLPNVSYVTPPGLDSDHAGDLSAGGPGWVGTIYLAIAESENNGNPACQYYGNTAMIVTWDDSGGWYDHVFPPTAPAGGYSWGLRVPLIVASAWASHGSSGGLPFVSHVQRDFGSILKYIESNWNLGTLGEDDANADNLSDMFNYTQTPVPPISATKMRQWIQATHFNLQAAKLDRTPYDDQ